MPFASRKGITDMETKLKAHTIRINSNKGTAYCSCGGWVVQGFSKEYSQLNHKYHLAGLPDSEKERIK
jgi:hypothetical protein